MNDQALRIGSLCSGYEGIGLAVREILGGELAWVADNDDGAAAILAHRFPLVKNLGDITLTDWAGVEPVDVLTAGFPCQDVSAAGKRAGLRRGNRSGIWLVIVHAIAALRPRLVIIENVRGLLTARGDEPTDAHLRQEAARDAAMRLEQWLGNELNIAVAKGDADRVRRIRVRAARVMGARKRAVARCAWHERRLVRAIGTVLGSLADLGYDARWTVVGADDAGACHQRKRVFIVAWPAANAGSIRWDRRAGLSGARRPEAVWEQAGGHGSDGGDPFAEDPDFPARGERGVAAPGQAEGGRARADAGRRGGVPAADADGAAGGRHEPGSGPGSLQGAAVAERAPVQPGRLHSGGEDESPVAIDWGAYAPTIARWEAILGRPAPRPVEPGRTGERLSPAFVEFLMGLPEGWVTGVPGLSRNDQLKALGNGVVPQQCALALRLLLGGHG